MEIKKLANNQLKFYNKKVYRVVWFGNIYNQFIVIHASLLSYSPEDPNFVFPENTEIHNILGFKGSFVSDLFFSIFGSYIYTCS